MRDDLARLYRQLHTYFLEKIRLYTVLNANMKDKHYYLNNGNIEQIEAILSAEKEIISDIDLLDYEIGRKMDSIASISGITRNSIMRTVRTLKEQEANDVVADMEMLGSLSRQLYAQNEKLCSDMSVSLGELKKDLSELQNLILLSSKDLDTGD